MTYQDFLDRYQSEFGENLATLLETFPQYQISGQGAYNRIHRQIKDYIISKNSAYDFDTCKDYQNKPCWMRKFIKRFMYSIALIFRL